MFVDDERASYIITISKQYSLTFVGVGVLGGLTISGSVGLEVGCDC